MYTTEPGNDTDVAPDRKETVYRAVVDLATGTAGEIAAQAAIPYSTVTPKLRALLEEHRVASYRDDAGRLRWRPTATAPDTTPTTDTPTHPDDDGGDAQAVGERPPNGEDTPDTDHAAPDDPRPDPGPADTPTAATATSDTDAPTVKTPRRPHGAVRAAILAAFAAAGPATTYKVAQLHHLTGIAQGALANSLVALVNDRLLVQVVEKPATFQATAPK